MPTSKHQKLIAAFLILAATSTSLVLIFSSSLIGGAQIYIEPARRETSYSPQNAFDNSTDYGNLTIANANEYAAQTNNATNTNLTEALADNIALGFLNADPSSQQDVNGETVLQYQDPSVLASQVFGSYDWGNFKMPDWDRDVPLDKVKIIQNYKVMKKNGIIRMFIITTNLGKTRVLTSFWILYGKPE